MVSHQTSKRRRRGIRVTRKLPKNIGFKIANSVVNDHVKNNYDKSKTVKENIKSMGLTLDVNNIKGSKSEEKHVDAKFPAFMGFAETVEGSIMTRRVPTKKPLTQIQLNYAIANINKHGNNFKAMEKDIVTNYNQYTEKQIEKLITKYHESVEQTK